MIILIEPLCRDTSHEVFNAGFVELFSQAFPTENIVYCAEKTQIDCVRNALGETTTNGGEIEWRVTDWPRNWRWLGAVKGYFKLRRLVRSVELKDDVKIVFLSFDNVILAFAKILFAKKISSVFPVLLVLHGILEQCNDLRSSSAPLNPRDRLEKKPLVEVVPASLEIFRQHCASPPIMARKMARYAINHITNQSANVFDSIFEKIAPNFCANLKPRESNNFIYIVLSDHILAAIKRLDRLRDLPWRAIPLPRKMVDSKLPEISDKVIFSMFGYGLPKTVEQILIKLQQQIVNKPYEIRLIGNMPSKLLNYRNVVGPLKPGQMSRKEMERMNAPVHYQLILYPEDSYELSVSGSIFEAISASKPIIHLCNPCINHYNSDHLPIGYCERDFDGITRRIVDIIQNNSHHAQEYMQFHQNLQKLQKNYSPRATADRLVEIYSVTRLLSQ